MYKLNPKFQGTFPQFCKDQENDFVPVRTFHKNQVHEDIFWLYPSSNICTTCTNIFIRQIPGFDNNEFLVKIWTSSLVVSGSRAYGPCCKRSCTSSVFTLQIHAPSKYNYKAMLMVDHVDESGKITQMNFKQRHNSTSDQGGGRKRTSAKPKKCIAKQSSQADGRYGQGPLIVPREPKTDTHARPTRVLPLGMCISKHTSLQNVEKNELYKQYQDWRK